MPIYNYKAVNFNGVKVQGLIDAFNKRAAMERLGEKNLKVYELKDKTDSLYLKLMSFFRRPNEKDLVIFSRQFSVMISANLALVQALRICAEQTTNITLRMIISEIAYEVDGGATLSSALSKRPKIFTPFYTNVIRSGETSGRLDEVLIYLADEMEKDYDMSSKIKGAMIYPAFVLFGLTVVGLVMMIVVVPKLTEILQETGAQLPLSTRIVIAISNFLTNYWWILLFLVTGGFLLIKYFIGTPGGRKLFDLLKLKLPVFGQLFQLIYTVRFTRSLNTLIVGGVSIAKSLEIVSGIVDNVIYRDLIMQSKKAVEEGGSLAKVFLTGNEMPKMVPQMIIVGEKTGKLDLVLKKITDFYSRETMNILSNLVTLLEPLVMIVMGVGVGVMVAAILMPMYNLASQF
ncbi:MAG: type II secretion system F family protein [Patescibacteria group bacterium]|jgi:type IV pilus assembly protein PilC